MSLRRLQTVGPVRTLVRNSICSSRVDSTDIRPGSKSLDNYNQPILADVSWFSGIETKVKDILVWGGGGEVLIDSIDLISKKLQEAYPKTEYVKEPGASHEEFIIEKMFGYKGKNEGTQLVESWMKARL